MIVFVATFHGDIEGLEPMCAETLEELLEDIKDATGWGEKVKFHGEDILLYPDAEDDKIEIWKYDTRKKSSDIVWGFWGWHWTMPDGMNQGVWPNSNGKSLYELSMEDY